MGMDLWIDRRTCSSPKPKSGTLCHIPGVAPQPSSAGSLLLPVRSEGKGMKGLFKVTNLFFLDAFPCGWSRPRLELLKFSSFVCLIEVLFVFDHGHEIGASSAGRKQ